MPAWRGRGYATRAAVLLSDWALDIGIVRVIAGTEPGNIGSQRVLQRAGFVREGFAQARLPGVGDDRIDDVQWARIAPRYAQAASQITP
jgi:RimJ/RimL family protein N-acetyltransferase